MSAPAPRTSGGCAIGRRLRLAADIGGTFTDIALMLDDGTVATGKVPSTPDDYARGVVEGATKLLRDLGVTPGEVGEILHGCTVATNAILEGKGARTALVTTRGFRDVLEFRRVRVPRLYDPLYIKPEPLAPRELRFEVTERLAADGSVVTPLADDEVLEVARALARARVEAVAVCCLHSYANPAHERRVGEILRRELPGAFVTLSCELLPEIREYERTSTTVINAYVGPPVRSYVRSLAASLRAAGLEAPLRVMQSTGGILDAETAARLPARIVECGPAAGVIGAAHQARRSGYPNVITLDMGGTTAKAAMIEDGGIIRTDEYEVGGGISLSSRLVKGGGYALKLPVIDISEVGAGGGSIVWLDRGGALKVGPRSAGAVPGPACYGLGGGEATVTDANLVLGYINPRALAGGSVPIQAERARAAIAQHVAEPLGETLHGAAWAVHAVATANMMRAVKAVSTYRGRDPRECVLMAFGGNGGIFAVELARQLQMTRVLVPPAAGVFSAIGLTVAPVEFGQTRAYLRRLADIDPAHLESAFAALAKEVLATLGRGEEEIELARLAAMRYVGQAFELQVPVGAGPLDTLNLARLRARFAEEHLRSYGHRLGTEAGVEVVALQVLGRVRDTGAENLSIRRRARHRLTSDERDCYFGPDDGIRRTRVVDRSVLAGAALSGPLVIEEYDGTTIVPPSARASLDAQGNIVIDTGL